MTRKVNSTSTPHEVAMPITPMLDMAFQLMFFFITTFALNPQGLSADDSRKQDDKREGQMDLSLPAKEVGNPAKGRKDGIPEFDEVMKLDSEVTVRIRGRNNGIDRGQIDAISISGSAGDEELPRAADERDATLKFRLEAIKVGFAEINQPMRDNKPAVRLTADSVVYWNEVVRIMDLCHKSGFQVNFARPIDAGQN